jgi:hypothetical protein
MADILEQFSKEWTLGSWTIGQSNKPRWSASVHGYGVCELGYGNTAREAFDNAKAAFLVLYPDAETVKAKRLETLRKELAELESEA